MKIMKSITIAGIIIMSLLMMSCEENFLQVNPESEMTIDVAFSSNEDFNVAVNGVYSEYQNLYSYLWELSDLPGDDVVHNALRNQERVNIDNFAVDVNADIIHDVWSDLYDIIASANTVLSKIEASEESIITGKDQYEGEVRFLRALAYFHLVRLFGDVPMITSPITVQDAMEIPRTNVENIYNEVIIEDLIEAETKLPESYSSADIGRATSGAAKSLLGKVHLTRQDFDLAESKLMEVTMMGYSLLDNFEDLFNFDNEHHSEYIFDIEYISGNIGLGSPFMNTFFVHDQDVGGDFINALREVYNLQGERGGSGSGEPSEEILGLFEDNDLRKDRTVITGIYDSEENWVEPNPGLQVQKITLKYLEPGYNFGTSDGKANWRVLRYADVLLMLAEALNENGKTSEALSYLNQVRERAGLDGYTGLSQDETRERIYLERRLELYLEGHSWFDLVRTGRALDVMEPHGMESHMTVFPIPQSQIEVVNDPSILSQNPGY